MISTERLKSPPAPKVLNSNVSASAPVPEATASEDDMSVNSDDVSLDSSPENSRVSSGGVGRSYGRGSSCYTYSEVSSSRDTLVVAAARGPTEPRYDTDTEEDESTDSASSSQFSPPPPAVRINGGVSRVETPLPITDGGAAVEKVESPRVCVKISDSIALLMDWIQYGVV